MRLIQLELQMALLLEDPNVINVGTAGGAGRVPQEQSDIVAILWSTQKVFQLLFHIPGQWLTFT